MTINFSVTIETLTYGIGMTPDIANPIEVQYNTNRCIHINPEFTIGEFLMWAAELVSLNTLDGLSAHVRLINYATGEEIAKIESLNGLIFVNNTATAETVH